MVSLFFSVHEENFATKFFYLLGKRFSHKYAQNSGSVIYLIVAYCDTKFPSGFKEPAAQISYLEMENHPGKK